MVTDTIGNITDAASIYFMKDIAAERMVVIVDNDWLKNAAYPVIVDPAVIMSKEVTGKDNTADSSIASGYPTANYASSPYLHVGYLDFNTTNYKIYRSLIKFKYLPSIPPGAKITSATISMFMYLGTTSGTTINVYKIAGNWTDTQVNWNNQPNVDATPIISGYTSTPNTLWNIDITEAVNDWYSGTSPNYGLMIRASNEASPKISFYSFNETVNVIPKITINYKMDALSNPSMALAATSMYTTEIWY